MQKGKQEISVKIQTTERNNKPVVSIKINKEMMRYLYNLISYYRRIESGESILSIAKQANFSPILIIKSIIRNKLKLEKKGKLKEQVISHTSLNPRMLS